MSAAGFLENLLDGAEVVWKPLEAVATIKHGRDWKNLKEGVNPVYGSGGIMGYVDEYSYNKPTVLIPRKGSISNIFYVEEPFWNVDTIYYTEIDESQIIPKFLYYFICTLDMMSMDTGSGRPSLTLSILKRINVPIPCPDDPKKSVTIQREVVRILDSFTGLTTELTTELAARKTQYSCYRDRLLSFEGGDVEWKPLDELGEFIRGRRFTKADYVDDGIGAIHYGEIYTHYGVFAHRTLSQVRSDMAGSLRYAEQNDVVIAGVSETIEEVGKAVAWLGEEKVAIHDDSYAFRHQMNPKFIAYAMQTESFHEQKAKYVSSGKIKRLLIDGIKNVRLPVPYPDDPKKSLEEQARVVAILDKFNTLTTSMTEGLPREIELREKQYAYYRDLLFSFPNPNEVAA